MEYIVVYIPWSSRTIFGVGWCLWESMGLSLSEGASSVCLFAVALNLSGQSVAHESWQEA